MLRARRSIFLLAHERLAGHGKGKPGARQRGEFARLLFRALGAVVGLVAKRAETAAFHVRPCGREARVLSPYRVGGICDNALDQRARHTLGGKQRTDPARPAAKAAQGRGAVCRIAHVVYKVNSDEAFNNLIDPPGYLGGIPAVDSPGALRATREDPTQVGGRGRKTLDIEACDVFQPL